MAELLSLDGLVVPVEYPDGLVKEAPVEIGDRGRAFLGNQLTSIRASKDRWSVRTQELTRAEADAVIAKVKTPGIPCTGEGITSGAAVVCTGQYQGEDILSTPLGRRFKVRFTIEQD